MIATHRHVVSQAEALEHRPVCCSLGQAGRGAVRGCRALCRNRGAGPTDAAAQNSPRTPIMGTNRGTVSATRSPVRESTE